MKPGRRLCEVREVLSKGTPIVFWATLPPNFGNFGGAAAKGVFKSETGQMGGKHVAAGRLVPLLSAFAPPPMRLSAVFPSARHASAALRALLDFLEERMREAA